MSLAQTSWIGRETGRQTDRQRLNITCNQKITWSAVPALYFSLPQLASADAEITVPLLEDDSFYSLDQNTTLHASPIANVCLANL